MFEVLGVDKGTTYTKTDRGLIIRSTVRTYRKNEVLLDNEKNIVEYEGSKYIVGEKGNYSTDLMKSQHENTKLLILTAVGLSFTDRFIETNIVTGLPIALYSSQKQQMKDMLQRDSTHQITINGQKKYIRFPNIEVFPESAGAFYSQSEYTDALIVDIGGLSIDIALFEKGKLIKYSTYPMGVMKLYSKITNYINSQYDLSLTEWDMEKVLNEGLYIYGERVELNYDYLIKEHIEEIIERLKLEYDLKIIANVLLTGGGSQWIYKHFQQYIPQAKLMANSQFSNVIGYRNIGKVIFR